MKNLKWNINYDESYIQERCKEIKTSYVSGKYSNPSNGFGTIARSTSRNYGDEVYFYYEIEANYNVLEDESNVFLVNFVFSWRSTVSRKTIRQKIGSLEYAMNVAEQHSIKETMLFAKKIFAIVFVNSVEDLKEMSWNDISNVTKIKYLRIFLNNYNEHLIKYKDNLDEKRK